MHFAFRGDNKSPAFTFNWTLQNAPTAAPPALQSYAIIFHDLDVAMNNGSSDNLHWTIWNIPGTAKGLPEGLPAGDLPDGSRQGPGLMLMRMENPSYFGPGAGVGPFHHYIWELYALDTKLTLPVDTTRDGLLKAMEGHVIGKASYTGRFHATP